MEGLDLYRSRLFSLAERTCALVAGWQPDVILTCYRGARVPQLATQALWAVRYQEPLPPVVPLNWGREKGDRYEAARKLAHLPWFLEWYRGTEWGSLLAWIDRQEHWIAGLRERVLTALEDRPPRRILWLDDCCYEGLTKFTALGLSTAAFPQAASRFISQLGLCQHGNLAEAWLQAEHPLLMESVSKEIEALPPMGLNWPVDAVVALDDESLDWQPLTLHLWRHILATTAEPIGVIPGDGTPHDVKAAWALSHLLPPEEWMALPAWVEAWVQGQARSCADEAYADDTDGYVLPPMAHIHRRARQMDLITGAELKAALRDEDPIGRWLFRRTLKRQGRGRAASWRLPDGPAILAYGSLIADPGWELQALTTERILDVETPFRVEYARKSATRDGAPTLTVVTTEGLGAPVRGTLLILDPNLTWEHARDLLYRREIHRVGDSDYDYEQPERASRPRQVFIERLENLDGIKNVLYARLEANLEAEFAALPDDDARGAFLANLAWHSVTPGTYEAGRDGIRYLDDALSLGIITPLSEAYVRAIIYRAGPGCRNLEQAREIALKSNLSR